MVVGWHTNHELVSGLAGVHTDMLLKNQRVGELLVTNGTLVEHAHRRLGAVHAHVRLQVALGCERAGTDLAAEWALAGVNTVVHLKRTLTAEDAVADRALVRVGKLLLYVLNQLLQLAGLRFGDLHVLLEVLIIHGR